MDTAHVKEFLVFCESMNYSVAARELYCSRSALRQHIAYLEAELQVPLVESTPAGHRLTVFGQHFKPEARRLVEQAEGIAADMARMRENLLVVTVSSSSLAWLRGILFDARSRVIAEHPQKQIQINTVAGTLTSPCALAGGCSDIAVFRVSEGEPPLEAAGLPEHARAFKLATDQIRYYTGVANPISRLPRVTAADLKGQRLVLAPDIYESCRRRIERSGGTLAGMDIVTRDFTDYQEYYAGSFEDTVGSVPARLMAHYGIADRPDLKVLDIEGLEVRSDFYVACTEEFLENPTALMLFDEMERLAAEALAENGPAEKRPGA